MKPVIIFDVNETLLNVGALAPHFERVFGDKLALPQWFAQLLQTTYVVTLTGHYRDFSICSRHALDIVAQRRGVVLSDTAVATIVEGMLNLPPYPEVPASIARLREAGFRLATLTNSAPQAMLAQLKNAGLIHLFDKTLSVDKVRHFKPHPAIYLMAADELGVQPHQMRMVAAHNWDTTGAICAGCKAAFVARPGMVLGPLDEVPDIIDHDMDGVVTKIIENDLH